MLKEDFIEEIKKINWTQLLNTSRDDINHSFDTFISILNTLLDKHAPFKTMIYPGKAQMVERSPRNRMVRGLIPPGGI